MSTQPEALQRSFDNGKYTVINNNGLLSALRYGDPWRDLTGDNLVAAMLHEVDILHKVNTELLEALQAVMTEHEDGYGLKCVEQVKATIAKATGETQ
jgi:hypothetical protein